MKVHDLKCWPEFYAAVEDRRKQFEIRYNDRDYQVGDVLRIHEYEPLAGDQEGRYTGREVEKVIAYMTEFNQKPGWVVLGFTTSGPDKP